MLNRLFTFIHLKPERPLIIGKPAIRLLPPSGLSPDEAHALIVTADPPPAFARVLADIALRVTLESAVIDSACSSEPIRLQTTAETT